MEAKLTTAADHNVVGLSNDAAEDNTSFLAGTGGEGDANIAYQYGYKSSDGKSYNNASGSSYGNTYAEGDIVGMYVDLDNNKIYWSKKWNTSKFWHWSIYNRSRQYSWRSLFSCCC